MKAMLYMDKIDEPVSILDNVKVVVTEQANHSEHSRYRIFYRTKRLNATKTMIELHRDRKMTVKLEDGRTGSVLLTHSTLDPNGEFVGVLRVLGALS
jgi:hypothetical protein